MKKNGFTLIEVIVATGLVSILLVVISALMSNGYKSYRIGQKRISANEEAAEAISDFEKIVRGTTSIIVADNQNYTFYSYLKGDNHPAPSKISYYLSGSTFFRSTIPPTQVGSTFIYQEEDKVVKELAQNVILLNFDYSNAVSETLAFPIQLDVVRLINLTIAVDDNISQSPDNARQSTSVQLRNLKTNL